MRAEATQGAESLHSQGGSAGAPSSSDLAAPGPAVQSERRRFRIHGYAATFTLLWL